MMILVIVAFLVVAVGALIRYKHISPLSIGVYDPVNQGVFSDTALGGYDPVAYFEEGAARKGREDLSLKWNDATWKFALSSNLERFRENPERFAPMYGGYCSFAVSKGFSADTDPEAFVVRDSRLYVFSEPKFRDKFVADFADMKEVADRNWAKVR